MNNNEISVTNPIVTKTIPELLVEELAIILALGAAVVPYEDEDIRVADGTTRVVANAALDVVFAFNSRTLGYPSVAVSHPHPGANPILPVSRSSKI